MVTQRFLTFLLLFKLNQGLHDHFLMIKRLLRWLWRALLLGAWFEGATSNVHHLLLLMLRHTLEGLWVRYLEVQISCLLHRQICHTLRAQHKVVFYKVRRKAILFPIVWLNWSSEARCGISWKSYCLSSSDWESLVFTSFTWWVYPVGLFWLVFFLMGLSEEFVTVRS